MAKVYFALYLFLKTLPDFERFGGVYTFICELRAKVLSKVGANKKIGQGVLIHRGFDCSMRMDLEIGNKVKIYPNVTAHGKSLKIGQRSVIFSNCYLDCTSSLEIGSEVCIGKYCEVYSHVHHYDKKETPIFDSPESDAPSIIEDSVLLYNNAKIMPGVTVAKGSIVGNSSIVYKDTVGYGVYIGNPARKVDERK